ncbi:MAG: phenylalanine--tRNA ligase subunit beta [Eubacteriales bacterium]|nr:phenylalanine--tRNA ligase subunit beta [Eubacteriales bacterium]
MLIPINWLKDYVDIDKLSVRELSDGLTLSGSHVDSIINLNKGIRNVVVGRILSLISHEDADSLKIAQVDVGSKVVQIVTGALNIKTGDLIPIALDGAVLPGNKIIEDTVIRGQASQGMMCSYEELGVEDKLIPKESRNGILILPSEFELGRDINEVLGFEGSILDIEITFNRPDCLSILGIARESAATFEKSFNFPDIEILKPEDEIGQYLKEVRIDSNELCTRYYAKVIKDVKIGPSPLWLQRKIMDAGMRPVNNIVDATNYVMIEMGQPLHAFDLEKMKGRKVIVRAAREGETILTLDKEIRQLSNDMCVIADEDNAQCIGGVMGGYESEITENTQLIIMECANFNSKSIRFTSKKLGLRSEASSRNEKALSPRNVSYANERVCQIIEQIGAGTIVNGHYDVGVTDFKEKTVTMRPYKCDELLGVTIDTDRMIRILNSLEIESRIEGDVIVSKVPHFRPDIEQEADLIEEVGRIYGFEKIEPQALKGDILKGTRSDLGNLEESIKCYLSGIGFCEITTYSFISPKKYAMLNIPQGSDLNRDIRIINPLGEDFSSMRTTLLPGVMDVVAKNTHYGNKKGKLYEVGNIFRSEVIPIIDLPQEIRTLSMAMYGDTDYYQMKGVVDNIFRQYQIDVEHLSVNDNPSFHPGRTAGIYHKDTCLGIMGEIHPLVAKRFDIKEKIYIAELNLENILSLQITERKYSEIPKFPSITRDMALVIGDEFEVGEVIKEVKRRNYAFLEKVEFFDMYKGKGIDEGFKSLAFSFVFRSKSRTLNDEEINQIFNHIVTDLQKSFNARLR